MGQATEFYPHFIPFRTFERLIYLFLEFFRSCKNLVADIHQTFGFIVGQIFFFNPFNDQCSHHIETSQLICRANQVTGFYMMRTLVVKWFKKIPRIWIQVISFNFLDFSKLWDFPYQKGEQVENVQRILSSW